MALRDAPRVDVLRFDENDAYDHDRPLSSLIRTQLLHLHHAESLAVPPKARTNININDLHTERQASEYIQRVTALLHRHGKRSQAKKKIAARAGTASQGRGVGQRAKKRSNAKRTSVKKRASRE
jgi:hypothetical protein